MFRVGVFGGCCFAALVTSLFVSGSAQAQSEKPPAVLCLHTEYLPYKHEVDRGVGYAVYREFSRQALLIAAREELGYTTCDITLGESIPKKGKVVHLVFADRPALNKTWEVRLFAYDPKDRSQDIRDLWATQQPIWQKTYEWSSGGSYSYGEMYGKFESDSRGEFVEALKLAGLEKQPEYAGTPTEYELADMEQAMLQPDFIQQYGAVRAAHQHIRTNGQSPEMLGILARGYANLSMLTYHQWNAASEAFMARAMLYGKRLTELEGDSESALWNRAYMWAVVGCHYAALDDLKKLGDAEPPAWGTLITPLVKYDYEGLKQIAANDEALAGMALRLHFVLVLASRYSEWIEPNGIALAQKCPTDYGVMAELAVHCYGFRATRGGVRAAPTYFARNAHKSLDAVKGLPPELKAMLPTDPVKARVVMSLMNDPDPSDPFSAFPTFASARLRKDSSDEVSAGLSWQGLAYLMDEEVFVQIANFMEVSLNATEHSMDQQVDSVMPFIAKHRYAKYIESFKYWPLAKRPKLTALLKEIEPVDIDPYSREMLKRHVSARADSSDEARYGSSRDFTLMGVTNSAFGNNPIWELDKKYNSSATMFARELGKVAPHSEVSPRLAAMGVWKPNKKLLKEWEKKIKTDAAGFYGLGRQYEARKDVDKAIKYYEKSIEQLPISDAYLRLAALHKRRGDDENWEKVLVSFLDQPDGGLKHARIECVLAGGFIEQGKWKKALPHAQSAGQTWSGWGLAAAGQVTEGLAMWEESEQWMREASKNYPSSSGHEWYFWCRRTGRGDVESARALAHSLFEGESYSTKGEGEMIRGAYRLLDERFEEAYDSFLKGNEGNLTYVNSLMLTQMAQDMGDEQSVKQLCERWDAAYPNRSEKDNAVDDASNRIFQMIKEKNADEGKIKELDTLLQTVDQDNRTILAFFLARQLEAVDESEQADQYYRKALTIPNGNQVFATLAGARLAEKYHTSRKVDDVLDEDDLWPRPSEKKTEDTSEKEE